MHEREVEVFISDNEALLNVIVNKYGDELKRIAYLYVKDRSQCEDIVQEVFISCYKNINKFRGEASYKTWLYRITINKCKDHHKRWNIKNIIYKPIHVFKNSSTKSTQDYLEQIEESNDIINAILILPLKYKEVLILYYYQELNMKEIGEITCTKINTVKSRIVRGRALLRTELEKRGVKFG